MPINNTNTVPSSDMPDKRAVPTDDLPDHIKGSSQLGAAAGAFYDESPLSLPEKVFKGTVAAAKDPSGFAKAMFKAPGDAIGGVIDSQGQLLGKAIDSYNSGDYSGAVRHAIGSVLPLIGPSIDQAGDEARSGQYGKAIGRTLGVVSNVAIPDALSSDTVRAGARKAADTVAAKLEQSATKPIGTDIDAIDQAMLTMPREGITSTKAGRELLASKLGQTGHDIAAVIQKAPMKPTISSSGLETALTQTRGGLLPSEQAALDSIAEQDIYGPLRMKKGDAQSPMRDMTPQEAWETKVKLQNAAVKAKAGAYDAPGSARNGPAIETYQTGAGNLGEQLVSQFPELADKNKLYSELSDVRPINDAATKRISNRDPWGGLTSAMMGVAGSVGGAAVGGASGAGVGGLTTALAARILTDPILRQRAAIFLADQSEGAFNAATASQRLTDLAKATGVYNLATKKPTTDDVFRPRPKDPDGSRF
jgi:hypothetical protein